MNLISCLHCAYYIFVGVRVQLLSNFQQGQDSIRPCRAHAVLSTRCNYYRDGTGCAALSVYIRKLKILYSVYLVNRNRPTPETW